MVRLEQCDPYFHELEFFGGRFDGAAFKCELTWDELPEEIPLVCCGHLLRYGLRLIDDQFTPGYRFLRSDPYAQNRQD